MRQFDKGCQHRIGCVLGGRDGGGRAPGAGGQVLGSGAGIADHGTHFFGGNTELAADGVGERSADALSHFMATDADDGVALVGDPQIARSRAR